GEAEGKALLDSLVRPEPVVEAVPPVPEPEGVKAVDEDVLSGLTAQAEPPAPAGGPPEPVEAAGGDARGPYGTPPGGGTTPAPAPPPPVGDVDRELLADLLADERENGQA
ncbi:MAG: hypothetical protein AB1716_21270, partial [Planctomycetota bacterium]